MADEPTPTPKSKPPLILGANGKPLNATEDCGVLIVNGKGDVVAVFELQGCPVEHAVAMVQEGLAKYAVKEPIPVDEEDAPVVDQVAQARAQRDGSPSDA